MLAFFFIDMPSKTNIACKDYSISLPSISKNLWYHSASQNILGEKKENLVQISFVLLQIIF